MENSPKGPLSKKLEAEHKLNFDLHVSLIRKQDQVPKTKALFTAWLEGAGGLNRRLNPPAQKPAAADPK